MAMPVDPRDKSWVIVLEERSCPDTRRRVIEWREGFDPTNRIPDDEIKIETYRTGAEPDFLRVSVRPSHRPDSGNVGEAAP